MPLTFGVALESDESVSKGFSGLVILGNLNVGNRELVEKLIEHVLVNGFV
jgi:hypothetical protein